MNVHGCPGHKRCSRGVLRIYRYFCQVPDVMFSSCSETTLVVVTEEAQRALGGASEVRVAQFPFNVGREGRSPLTNEPLPADAPQRRHGEALPMNDLYLREESSGSRHISREYFAIECVDSWFFLVDRGSACGTIVAGRRIGGHRKSGRTELRDGDEVVIGTSRSHYIFRFRVVTTDSQRSPSALHAPRL